MVDAATEPLRLAVVQPTLAAYRLPVFQRLAKVPGIDLHLVYASTPSLNNVQPQGFRATFSPMTIRHLRGHPFYWQAAQLDFATPAQADVLMLNWDAHYLSLVPALLKAKREGVATVLWGHGYSRHSGRVRSLPRQAIARLADAIVFYNETGKRMYASLGLKPERLFVAYNSVDHSAIDTARRHWTDRPDELRSFTQSAGIDESTPLILFVARLTPERRVDLLIEAARQLKDRRFTIAIIGSGDAKLIDSLKQQAEQAGLGKRLCFVGPCYDEVELAKWFSLARVFCFPAYIGLSLLHAFAYGVPVITSDRADVNGPEFEALRDDQNGLLYRDNDAADLARQLARVLDNPSFAKTLGANARRTIDETFNIDRMVRSLADAARFAMQARDRK